jgi:predicted O-methyltransferase YrrM
MRGDMAINLKSQIKSLLLCMPGSHLIYRLKMQQIMGVEPGHYYSPIPDLAEIKRGAQRIFAPKREILGIDLREKDQLELLDMLIELHRSNPFHPGPRYTFDNGFFPEFDGTIYYLMLRHLKPKRVIEIGSGYSSALLLDVNEQMFDSSIDCTFIEPSSERLLSLVNRNKINLYEKRVQDIPVSVFQQLEVRDILFIDSSHITKMGSDVNHLLFEILPKLNPGVIIHIHDIHFPFEYPAKYALDVHYFWNEAYIVRAFLQYNEQFQILFFNSYLARCHAAKVESSLPLSAQREGGSLWLSKS